MSNIVRPLFFALILQLGLARAHDVKVEVEPHKSIIMLGEPLIVSATVRNNGSEPVLLIHHNAPTLFRSTLSIVALRFGADEENLKEWSDYLRPVYKTKPKLIGAGESITIDLMMLFNREAGFFAKEPGKYWISGRIYNSEMGDVFSPPVQIEVLAPSAMADCRNWDWLNANKEEYGRMVQVPWEAKLSDEFLREASRRCESSQSVYGEYLGLFLGRAYREGPKKDAELSTRFAEMAKVGATSDKIRSEADRLLRSPKVETPPAPPPTVARAVDAATQRAVTDSLENFAAAFAAGRMDDCATMLSEDFLRNGGLNKTRALEEFEEDLPKLKGGVLTIRPEAFSALPEADEVEVSGRFVAVIPGRQVEEHKIRWVLRRDGSGWVIRRWDPAP